MKTCPFRTSVLRAALVITLSIALLSLSPLPLSAQDGTAFNPLGRDIPTQEMEKQLRIQVEWFEISHEDMTELMEPEDFSKAQLLNSSNNGPLRERMKKMVADDKAKLLETAIVLARSGQRAKAESIYEFIYPTEYDPPELPTKLGDLAEKSKEAGDFPMSPPNAVAFETRNVGTTLEVDPVIGADDRTIDLNLAPELVYPVGELIYGEYDNGKAKVEVKMPVFYSVRITTQVTLRAGEYLMIGSATPFETESGLPDNERKILVFVKADVLYTGLPLEMEDGQKPKAEAAAKGEKKGGAKKK